MTTFPDPRVTKADFVRIMREHAAADHLIAGRYGSGEGDSFRGCAIGCGVETINRLTGERHAYGDHTAVADALGIPLALAYLEDRISEGVAPKQRRAWPVRFAEAIPEGVDLAPAVPRILVRILREVALPAVTVDESGVGVAVEAVCRALETGRGRKGASAAADAAAYAAFYAARAAGAARAAAYAAFYAARAGAYAAFYAACAGAEYAARAADAAAARAADATRGPYPRVYSRIANIVIEEMQKCTS